MVSMYCYLNIGVCLCPTIYDLHHITPDILPDLPVNFPSGSKNLEPTAGTNALKLLIEQHPVHKRFRFGSAVAAVVVGVKLTAPRCPSTAQLPWCTRLPLMRLQGYLV